MTELHEGLDEIRELLRTVLECPERKKGECEGCEFDLAWAIGRLDTLVGVS